ncbi:MAG: efflux transporter periplasmic adaptor subunit [Flavobacterium sp. BFFFF1]|uniref:efflux RND transporter periplasmic adaptor subunit n=1 Tax=Flavobacterium sp. BFFFF1 TaxID=2015557 RepID=UPI000BCF5C53|nr:efflux RND transporter periplasmic adaptor subunit [Flavobacterium sp. BFFFF1]OYU79758.1 MAG: efflux transporter periplasmic adaptor subunit [Flavobacterium sp. BFFFF1]
MKKWIVILIALLAAAAIAYFYFRNKKVAVETFDVAKAEYGYIAKSITATGTIQPVDTVAVGAQVSGVIKRIYADFNSQVKKGQLIAAIDPSIILAQKEQSVANLANALSNSKFQQSTYERQRKLFALGVVSQADYQLAQNNYNVAKAALDNARAQLRITTKNLSYTNIYSPIDGMVLNRAVSEGQTIASSFNAPTLFVIAKDLTKMQVRAAVDEADIGDVKSGQNVSFTVDAFPDEIFKGSVQQILLHARVNANVVTYTTLINVDNTSLKLKPGMTASISIYTKEDSKALLIPAKALAFKPDSTALKQFVIIHAKTKINSKPKNPEAIAANAWIKSGDTLFEKPITTTMTDDINVNITGGLKEGEEVITNLSSSDKKSTKTPAKTSPFMPKMGNRKASKPAK